MLRKWEGREQRIEERFRVCLWQLLSCSSILTTISLHCIVIRHVYYSKYLLIIWWNMYIQILLPKTLPTVRFLQFWPEAPMFWCYPHMRWDKNSRVMYPTMKEQRHRRLSFVIEWGAEESSFPKWQTSSQGTSERVCPGTLTCTLFSAASSW